MARTPLMRALRQIAAEHREAKRRGITPEQVHEEGTTRREFLKRSGMAAAAIPLTGAGALIRPQWANAATISNPPRIAIVGGGIAGLNAALTLAAAGFPSTVYESSQRLGGRMHSDSPLVFGGDNYFAGPGSPDGQVAEYCGEFIDTGHKTILHLAQQFGLQTVDVNAAVPNASTETYYFQGGYYPYSQASIDFKPVHQVIQGQLNKAPFPQLYNTSTDFGRFLDNMSLYDWIENYVPGGHGSNFGRLLDSAYNQEYGSDTTDQSSLNLIYLLGYQPSPGNFSIYGLSDERYHIVGGNQQLPEAIAKALPGMGVTIKTGMRMTAVGMSGSRVNLSFDNGSSVTVDQAILCMSFSVLRTLDYSKAGFDKLKITDITQLGSGRNAKLNLQFNSRYWNQSGPWGISNGDVYTDIGFQNAWDVTRGQPGTNGIMVNYTGGSVAGTLSPPVPYSNASNDPKVTLYAKAFLKQLEVVYPGISKHWNGKAVLSTPFLDPNLLCSYSYWRVGQYTTISGYEGVPQPDPAKGPIHFAGEHCSINYQGYMEGGASEGARAANEILSLYK